MFQRTLALACVTALIFCLPGIAQAKAVKVDLQPFGQLEPDASGQVVLNYAKGSDKTVVQVNCWGLTPDTEFTVYLNDGSYYMIGTFTTDEYGEGNLHVFLDGDRSADLPVAVNDTELNATVLLGP